MEQMDHFAFLVPVMMATFGVVFFIMAWFKMRSALAWGLGFLSAGLAFFVPILPMPVELQALAADAFFICAFYFYGEALLIRFDAPLMTRPRVIFALLAFAGAIVAVIGFRNVTAELLIIDLSISLLLAFSVVMVATRAKDIMERILVLASTLVVADTVIRLVFFTFFVTSIQALEDFEGSPYSYVMQVSVGAFALCFALSAMGALVMDTLNRYRDAAERDPLTGLYNRRGFDKAVEALSVELRSKSVMLNCDIDHFKSVNDSFGHAAGDQVISGLGDVLTRGLPANAIAARFGGEEFVVLLPDMNAATGVGLAQSLRMTFAARDWRPIGVDRQITISFGVASLDPREPSTHDAIARADRALYAAKAGGRNQVMVDASTQTAGEPRVVPFMRSAR